MSNRIAFNPQDRFVVAIGNTLIVTTRNGDTFGHDITGHTADSAFQFSGAKAAFNTVDRFVTTMGNRLIVCTENGNTFGHDVSGRNIGPAFQFTGARAAFNTGDRFVVTIRNMLIVCTDSGDVFGHEISDRNIGPAFKFSGSKAAFNRATDRFVVTMGDTLIVCTQSGDVFGHDVSGHNISPPFKFNGSRMAFNLVDRFVVTVGNTMVVTTRDGPAFGADIANRNIGSIFRLNPDLAIRLHAKLWTNPTIPLRTMLTSMQDVYATAGIGVVLASVQDFTGTNIHTSLRDLEVGDNCQSNQLSGEQIQLFNNRDNVGEFDVVAHFVRTIPGLNGCAAHPDSVPGAAVAQYASVWTLAHEMGHVLGLQHIDGENTNCPDDIPRCCSTPDATRLMTGCSTSNIIGTPTIDQGEINTLRGSNRTRPS